MKVEATYKSIFQISYPIILGLIAQNLMVVIDTAFLGRVGEIELGAAAIGGILFLTMMMLGTGFGIGTQILIGRRNGEGNYHQIGVLFDHSIYFQLALAIILIVVYTFMAPQILVHFIDSEAVKTASLEFLSMRKWGFVLALQVICFNSLYVGSARTKVISLSTIIMSLANIILDYGLIFGNLGMPEMGISGAALATNIAEGITFLFLLFYTLSNSKLKAFKIFKFPKPDFVLLKKILNLSGPVMLQHFISFSAWFVFFMIIEQMGETQLAASNITRSIYMLLMIPVWGLSSATNTLVSNIIGQGKMNEVFVITKKIMILSVITNLIIIQAIVWIPDVLISFYTDDVNLIEVTRPVLYTISFALIAFSVGMTYFSALSGTGKTKVGLRIEIITISIYMIATYFLAVYLKAPLAIVWAVEAVYFSVVGFISFLYLKSGKWKSLKI